MTLAVYVISILQTVKIYIARNSDTQRCDRSKWVWETNRLLNDLKNPQLPTQIAFTYIDPTCIKPKVGHEHEPYVPKGEEKKAEECQETKLSHYETRCQEILWEVFGEYQFETIQSQSLRTDIEHMYLMVKQTIYVTMMEAASEGVWDTWFLHPFTHHAYSHYQAKLQSRGHSKSHFGPSISDFKFTSGAGM